MPRSAAFIFSIGEKFRLGASQQQQGAPPGKYFPPFLIAALELTGDPRIRGVGRFFDHLATKPHQISFESRMRVSYADFSQPSARTDPIGQHTNQQSLAIGATGYESRQAIVLAHMIPVIVKMLSVFLQPCPTHSIDDGQRAVFAAG